MKSESTKGKESESFLKGWKGYDFHELSEPWTFFYLIPDKTGGNRWDEYLKDLHDITKFEEFYAIIYSVLSASKLPKGCRYYIFKQGIKPMFEDPANSDGEEISVEYKLPIINPKDPKKRENEKKMHQILEECAESWINLCTVIFCNNNYIRHRDYINGIEFNHRSNIIKIGVWTKKIEKGLITQIQEDICKAINFVENQDAYKKVSHITIDRIPENERTKI